MTGFGSQAFGTSTFGQDTGTVGGTGGTGFGTEPFGTGPFGLGTAGSPGGGGGSGTGGTGITDPDLNGAYRYVPPTWRNVGMLEGSLRFGVTTPTVVYRLNGVWHNVQQAGMDDPIVTNVDIDAASGLRLFFTKPMVVPGWLYAELNAITPADPSWSAGTLTRL